MTETFPYVGVYEAVRLIVDMLPGGAPLAPFLTDEWIKGGYASFDPAAYLADSRGLTDLYGPDWRDIGPKAIKAYRNAAELFKLAIRFPDVKMTGEVAGNRRPITDDERGGTLHLRDGMLSRQAGPPSFRELLICAKDLKRTVADLIDPPRYGSNAHKQRAVDEQIARYGLARLEDMGPDEAARVIANRVATEHPGVTAASSMIRGRIVLAKQRGDAWTEAAAETRQKSAKLG